MPRSRGYSLLFMLTLLAMPWGSAESAEPDRPKLAVVVYFDQLRGDFPSRWQDLFAADGFRRLQRDGAWFRNCHYPYAATLTGPGHASVATGSSPDAHGIIANDWFDLTSRTDVYCVGTDRYERLPPKPPREMGDEIEPGSSDSKKPRGVSPERLLAPTLGDALKAATGGRGKVVSLSCKDRSAALPGGQRPDACYWLDPADGNFVTSTYYRDSLHPWVSAFNAARPIDRWHGGFWTRLREDLDYERHSGKDDVPGEGKGVCQGVTFPHPFDGGPKKFRRIYHEQVYTSPFGNELLLEFAKRAIEAEQLGQDDIPDLLSLSFSSNDPVGHAWGPDSQEVLDTTLRTDLIIRDLLAFLDTRVGAGKYVLALTSDHGVCPLPEVTSRQGREATRTPTNLVTAKANEFLVKTFGGDEKTRWIEGTSGPWAYFNRDLMAKHNVKLSALEEALAGWFATQSGVQSAYTRSALTRSPPTDDPIGRLLRRSFHPERSGDVVGIVKPYHLIHGLTGTTHGAPYEYDRHVPLMVFGPGIRPGIREDAVAPQAAATILARSLGILPPAKAEAPVPAGLFDVSPTK